MLLKREILRTDISGMPLEWVNYQQAVKFYVLEQVAYTCGEELFVLHGGINSSTGRQSSIPIHSIIATQGNNHFIGPGYTPPLNNPLLFSRDQQICLYCGGHFHARDLSRDHVRPVSQGGQNDWNNVVTACKRCNNYKAGRTPEQAGLELLAIPFTPTHAEYIYLKGRHVLFDQMQFLQAHFPRSSPLHERIAMQFSQRF